MEAAAEQEGVVCVCAENKKTTLLVCTQLRGGGGAPVGGLRSLVFKVNWWMCGWKMISF